MTQIWFKLFFRNAKKNWLNVVVNIAGLTLGLAGLLIVLLYFNDENSYDQWNPNKDAIYKVHHIMSDGEVWSTSTAVEGDFYKNEIPEVVDFYLSEGWYYNTLITENNKSNYIEDVLEGENNFFDFFPFLIIEGSSEAFKEARNHIAISKKIANRFFKGVSAIGKIIKFDKRVFTVTTVFEGNSKSYFNPKFVIQFSEKHEVQWGNFSKNLFVKVTNGFSIVDVEQKMDAIFTNQSAIPSAKKDGIPLEEFQERHGLKVKIEKLTDIRLHTIGSSSGPEGKGNYELILIMLGLSILLIIISCVNFINLSTASASQRAKEVGVKKTLGLSKGVLVRQFVLEIVLQGFVAFIFSLILVEILLPSFNDFLRKDISLFESDVFLNVALIALFLSLFIGIIPGIYLANFKSVEVLKGNISRSRKGIIARNIMLALQFLISGFFLIGVMIIYNQVDYMMNKDLGFSGDQIVVVQMSDRNNRYQKYQLLKNELIKHPNIEIITSNYFIPGGGNSNSTNVGYNEYASQANSNAVDFEYLDLVKIKILKGRGLSNKFASDTIQNILVNETFAKKLGIYDDPIGKEVTIGFDGGDNGNKKTIVGMVRDYHVKGFDEKIEPVFIMHWNMYSWMREYNFQSVQFKIKPENALETIADIESYWKKNVEQGYPFQYRFLDKQFQRTFAKYQKQKRIFLILTAIVIIISLLGLFALATLTIQQRLKEVAIRKTLGASVKEIIIQLVKSFLKISIIASLILIPIAYYFMQNWLDNFVYRIDMPIWPYIITPILLLLLVFVVVGVKAFNATKIDLIKYLKFE